MSSYLRLTLNVRAHPRSTIMCHTTQVAELNTGSFERTDTLWMESPARHAIEPLVDGDEIARIRWCRVSVEDVACLRDVGALKSRQCCKLYL